MKNITREDVLETITKKNRITRAILLLIGSFFIALFYNVFVAPNNLVYGGIGGVAILLHNVLNISTTLIFDGITAILIIISIFSLGLKKTMYSITGFISYILMVNLTTPIAHYFEINFDSFFFAIIIYGLLTGIGYGLVYKTGFNTGGSDIIVSIAQKYINVPSTKLSNFVNGLIVFLGAISFGIVKSMYAFVFLQIINYICDQIILGSSTKKICFIKSNKIKKIEKLLSEEYEIGYTILEESTNSLLSKKNIVFCVVPTDRFTSLKNELLSIDKKIEFITKDCYTLEGGQTNSLISV